jgi:O-antigen/teichoic acid export membrane protein
MATAVLAILAVGAGLLVTRTPVPIATAIFLLSLGYIAAALLEFLYYVFRGLSRSDLESTLTVAQRTGTLCVALLVLWWRPDVRLLGAAMLLPVAAALWFALRWARQLVNQRRADDEALQHRPIVPADDARAVFAIGAGIVLSALYFRIDVFLVNAWSGPAAVGLYNAVFRLVDALRLFPGAVIAVMLPALFRSGDGRLITRLTLWLGAGTTVAAALLGAIAPWLIPALYGSSYADAVPAFRTLLFALPLMAVNLALTLQLLGWQGQRAYACICGGALLFNLALNGFLIPRLGILGAAWSTVWTETFVTVGCAVALVATGARALPLSERTAF